METNDDDPTYLFIRDVVDLYGYDHKWFVFMYHAFYSIESALKVCKVFPTYKDWDEDQFINYRLRNKLNFGYERRGLRDIANQVVHLRSVIEFIPIMDQYLMDNRTYRKAVEGLPFNGGWAGFKNAEIFEKSFGHESLSIQDLGIDHRDPNSDSDGPIPGLRLLYGLDNEYNKDFLPLWNDFGSKVAEEYSVSIGKIETCLCKFAKLCKGKYYPLHDIDEFSDLKELMGERDWKRIMAKNFPSVTWTGRGIQKNLKKQYFLTGIIPHSDLASEMKKINILDVVLKTL